LTTKELLDCQLRDGYLLIQPMTAPETIGSIILPQKYANEQPIGKVLAGEGDIEQDDWVLYKRAKAHDFNYWEMDDGQTVSLVDIDDILGILQPDGIIPVGRNVVLEYKPLEQHIVVMDHSELEDEEYVICLVEECANGIDTVKPGDEVVLKPNLLYFEVEYNGGRYFVCDIDELEAVVV
jgi:hypothetical protein